MVYIRNTLPVVFLALIVAYMPNAASAQNPSETLNEDWLRGYQADLAIAEEVLKSKDLSEWTQEEIEKYLFNTLYAIYCANNLYVLDHREHPSGWEELKETGTLDPWPANPFNNWEPVAWQEGGEFSPGDIIVQLCPPELYSLAPGEREVPMTYVMSINGSTESYIPIRLEDTRPLEPIYEWSFIPPGTVYITAFGTEPAWKTREKLERKRKVLAELAEQEANENNEEENQGE